MCMKMSSRSLTLFDGEPGIENRELAAQRNISEEIKSVKILERLRWPSARDLVAETHKYKAVCRPEERLGITAACRSAPSTAEPCVPLA